jgi:hypothetical protein
MISENTAAASSSRFAGSLSAASSGVSVRVIAIVVATINFTLHLLLPCPLRLFRDELIDPRIACSQTLAPEDDVSWSLGRAPSAAPSTVS